MEKHIYSVMLFDDIIEVVDREAFNRGTNRSQLINDVLAEHFGLQTPEQKIRCVFDHLAERLSSILSIGQNVGNSIQFGKSLKYKYRPKLNYVYEFVGNGVDKYAVLKVSTRTTNPELNGHLDRFFEIVSAAENWCEETEGCCGSGESNHRFIREFQKTGEVSRNAEDIASNLYRYMDFLDKAMNVYFDDPEHLEGFDDKLMELYVERYLAWRKN